MGLQFHETPMGDRYYNQQLPLLIKAVNRLADAQEQVLISEKRVSILDRTSSRNRLDKGYKKIDSAIKRQILNWLLDNEHEFQRINVCHETFRNLIYDSQGEYLVLGADISSFISEADKLIYG